MARERVPMAIATRVLFAHDRCCCICRDQASSRRAQIHHLDGDRRNNDEDNLAVLCTEHHGEAHTRTSFTRTLNPEIIRQYRDEWLRIVAQKRASQVSGSPLRHDASEFVGDVTVPDGSVFAPGEHFLKTWAIRNVGEVDWTDRILVRTGTRESPILPTSPASVPIPDTGPGQVVEISVPMVAPAVEGSSVVFFKMAYSSGVLCFPDRYPYGLAVMIQTVRARDADRR